MSPKTFPFIISVLFGLNLVAVYGFWGLERVGTWHTQLMLFFVCICIYQNRH